jgi:hypothetical protein
MFFIDDEAYTKHGYYLIDNTIKTLSKFEAFQLAGKDWSRIKFIYNEDVFGSYDWTIEPDEDIYELYRQRAQQLREKYDYLVLMYSGGIDSHTILETFLDNNIKLDEICSFNISDVADKVEKLNKEVFNTAIPFIETLNLKKIGTIFRTVEIGNLILDWWNSDFHCENFQYYSSHQQWSGAVRTYQFKSKIKDHVTLSESGKTICYIWGADKPTILVENNRYVLHIIDAQIDFGNKQYINRLNFDKKFYNFHDETFYISRDCPKISIKQSHMLIKLISGITKNDHRLKLREELPMVGPFVEHHVDNNIRKFLSKKTVDGCIYPKSLLDRFGDDKMYNSSMICSPKESWFLSSNHPSRKKFEDQLKHLVLNNKGYFSYVAPSDYRLFNDEINYNLLPKTIRHVMSRPYYITKENISV